MPVIPNVADDPGDAGAEQDGGMEASVDAEVVNQEHVMVGEKIVGVENVTLDERGQGAREAKPL